MGFRATWIAVPKSSAAAALTTVGLRARGGEEADGIDIGWWALELGEWFVVIGSGWDHMDHLTEDHARALSQNGRAIFWHADDTPMHARMAELVDGKPLWSLTHQDGTPTLEGAVPPVLHTHLATQKTRHDPEVDFLYEVAHMTGETIVGFRHDAFDPPAGSTLRSLRPADEPEPTRKIEEHGPFVVELVTKHTGACEVRIEAKKRVTVERILTLTFDEEQLRGVVEHVGGVLAAGDRRTFHLESRACVLRIDVSGLFGMKTFEIRSPG